MAPYLGLVDDCQQLYMQELQAKQRANGNTFSPSWSRNGTRSFEYIVLSLKLP